MLMRYFRQNYEIVEHQQYDELYEYKKIRMEIPLSFEPLHIQLLIQILGDSE
jgi:hypothetical protein